MTVKIPFRTVLALAAVCVVTGAAEPFRMSEMTVTARGVEALVSQTPGGVGVLDVGEIALEQPLSVTNAMTRLPGVWKSSDAAWGSAVNLRGLGRNRVVYRLDGSRIHTATDIAAQFGLVNPFDVEKVEVLKGPISSLYGSGSLGGVVAVRTRGADFSETPEWHGRLGASCSTNPEGPSFYGSSSYSSDRFWVFLSGSYRNYDSYRDADWDDVPNSQFDDWHGKVRLGWKWDDANHTEFELLQVEANDVGIPGMGLALPVGPDVTYPDTTLTLVSLTHTVTPESDTWTESRLHLYYENIDRKVAIDKFPVPAVEPPVRGVKIAPSADHHTFGAEWRNVFEIADHTVVAGLDWWRWSYEGDRRKTFNHRASGTLVVGVDTPLADSYQMSQGVFLEDDWQVHEAVTLNLGGRLDYIVSHSDAIYNWDRVPVWPSAPPPPSTRELQRGSENFDDVSWNAHAGVTWTFADSWSTTLIGASSYRAPDLLDRFKYIALAGGRALYGNPDLDPERSFFAEWGLHYTAEQLRASASLFVNQVNDLIVVETVDAATDRMANVNRALLTGAEADVVWRFAADWEAYASIAYVNGRDRTDDDDLRFTPPLNGFAGVRHDRDTGLVGAVELEWAAAQRNTPAGIPNEHGWVTVNANLAYRFGLADTRHEIGVAVQNLLNEDYVDYLSTSRGIDLAEPGIRGVASWTVDF